MKKYFFVFIFLFLPLWVFALKREPWLGNIYEFELTSEYSLATFSKVSNAHPPLEKRSYDHTLDFDLDFTFTGSTSADVDLYFQKTPRQNFGFQSTALQFRHQFLSDSVGDFMSFISGISVRYTAEHSLEDISCFSHGDVDVELNFSFGKEFDQNDIWRGRLWGYGAVGQANDGMPWVRGIAALDLNEEDRWVGSILIDGGKGFGRHETVHIDDFYGYGRMDYSYLDGILRFGIRLQEWGTLRFEYSHRFIAESCPSKVNVFLVTYLFPFSF